MNYRGINYYAAEPPHEPESYTIGEEIIECTVLVRVRRDSAARRDTVRADVEKTLERVLEHWLEFPSISNLYKITGVAVK